MKRSSNHRPNPKRVAAGKLNRSRRGKLTENGRKQLRDTALRNQPWKHVIKAHSTPRMEQAAIGNSQRSGSIRAVRRELKSVLVLIRTMRVVRSQMTEAAGRKDKRHR